MNRQFSTSERFMNLAKQGQGCENRLHIGDASGAHANTSTLDSSESIPIKERGGVTQDEYDRLLGSFWEEEGQQHELLIFPEGERDAVTIGSNDMASLQPEGFLSGNIIDFYVKYLQEEHWYNGKHRTHIFNSFFYTKLVENDGASTESEQRKAAFEKVQKWTGEVNIFEKAYVSIPVNKSSHWSLIIVCHLSSLTSSPDKHECPPCILHLDSVEGKHGNLEGHIRSYIIHAWRERYHYPNEDQLLALSQMKYVEVKVPQQDNAYDCGIYLLHFVELFLVESVDFSCVPNEVSLFTGLWDASEVSAKRRDIRNLILELSLAFRRKSRERQTQLSRLSRLRRVSQICEVFETRLDGNEGRIEDPQNNDLKQVNAGVDESEHADHQTSGEVALDSQQHTEIEYVGHQTTGEILLDDQQQREQLACAMTKSVKKRSKRGRNWSKDETSTLLNCKMEGGRFCKGKQATTDWIAISQEIERKLGTTPSGEQCRLRYDTLLKAYRKSKNYCMMIGKLFSEDLCQGELKLATNITEDWYNAIAELCSRTPHRARSPKRMKFTAIVDECGPTPMCPISAPHQGLSNTLETRSEEEPTRSLRESMFPPFTAYYPDELPRMAREDMFRLNIAEYTVSLPWDT